MTPLAGHPTLEHATRKLTDLFAPRVQAGADWLDEVQPGWYTLINTETLDMYAPDQCILGQTVSFSWGVSKIMEMNRGVPDTQHVNPASFGFDIHEDLRATLNFPHFIDHRPLSVIAWEVLEVLWVQQIKERYERN